MKTVTASEMRRLEMDAFASGRISSAAAMDRAGRAVAEAILDRVGRDTPGAALVLCGPGNNGGDGYVIACALRAAGWSIQVFGLSEADKMPTDAAAARRAWEALGQVRPLSEPVEAISPCDVVVDAVFGIGLSRPVASPLSDRFGEVEVLARANQALKVAVDLPSGLDTDSGEVLGRALPADMTVTFHALKPAHSLASQVCGDVIVADIGL
ncbi:MAG: NAD(P)H-hydrate epimerase [Pseudomonadota bacterium]